MFIGIFQVLAACFIWGFIFVIPQLMTGFSPFEVALGRYFFFGLISLLFMLPRGLKKWVSIPNPVWIKALIYSLIVTIIYYCFLVLGLRYSSASVMTLIAGISPISITFLGNWKYHTFSFNQLIFPTVLLLIGLFLVNIPAFQMESSHSTLTEYLFGILCGIMALVCWNYYLMANAQFMIDYPQISSSDWSSLIGVSTLAWTLTLGTIACCFAPVDFFDKYRQWTPELKSFLYGNMFLGIFCAWIGSYLWNAATKRLPVTLTGQLSIFETIFGLLFVYTYEQRLPHYLECVGIITLLGGVLLSLNIFNKAQNKAKHHT